MRRANILILDDDAAFGDLLAEALSARGYVCRTFCDASKLCRADWRWAHAAVVDLHLSRGQDGSRTLRRFIDAGSHLALILVTGHDAMVLDTAARAARDIGYDVIGALPKPLAVEDLFRALEGEASPKPQASEESRWSPSASDVSRGITRGEIRVVFQPKVDLHTGACCGFEALARWHSAQYGEVPPGAFVPVAERSGLIAPLTDVVLRKVVAAGVAWAREGKHPVLSVNLSAKLLEDTGIVERLAATVERTSLSPSQLMFELTETAVVAMRGPALEATARLRLAGFGLSLDDFGAGENRFERLIGLPLTELKLDRKFVDAVLTPHGERIVRGITAMAHSLGMTCVGEGIEQPGQVAALQRAGCDIGQGWFLGRPQPAPSFEGGRRILDIAC